MLYSLRNHWPEYLMEAALLAIFTGSICIFATTLQYPAWPVRQTIADPFWRRVLMGIAIGITAIAIIYSPWGKQSGAHINPAVTLTFLRLRKIYPWDAFFYIASQFAGGLAGIMIAAAMLGSAIADPSVNYVITIPGPRGPAVAFLAEFMISFGLMFVVLVSINTHFLARFTGVFVGILLGTFIVLVAPLSGVGLNPARTFSSALPAQVWTAIWIYFTATTIGMLLAAEVYLRLKGYRSSICAKLHHHNSKRCIFRCGYQGIQTP